MLKKLDGSLYDKANKFATIVAVTVDGLSRAFAAMIVISPFLTWVGLLIVEIAFLQL